jgi:hypothetical protein
MLEIMDEGQFDEFSSEDGETDLNEKNKMLGDREIGSDESQDGGLQSSS